MDRLCVIFTLVLLPTFVSTVSRLQTFCTQRSGQWFNTSQTCVLLSSETYSWNDGWDYCSSYVDTAGENDTIKGRLAHLISESELFSLRSMSFTVGSPTIYLGAGAFVRDSRNIDDWNWCDTKACGRDGGQAKHPITIDLSGVYINGGDKNCGEIEKNNRGLKTKHEVNTSNYLNHQLTTTNYFNYQHTKCNYVNNHLIKSYYAKHRLTTSNNFDHRLT
uniref:C-type lectin domain-containing protein n=1 Tax=Plectus sambesii TaxID=2011161 RepID=A0A914WKQ6_9BILA